MKKQRRRNLQYRGRKTHDGKNPLPILALFFLALAAVCRFAVPGMRFSAEFLVCAAVTCFLAAALSRWAKNSSRGKVAGRIFLFCLAVFAILFAVAEGVIITMGRGSSTSRKADAVIVFGAGVNGREPSPVLKSRIDAAANYLRAHPQVPAVLSGGRGKGEAISEAQAMKDGLTAQGISPSRLYLEEKATSTAENLRNSERLLSRQGIALRGKTVALVTSDFHLCRAQFLAKRIKIRTTGIPAETPYWWLSANYYTREAFALGWTLLRLA